MDNRATLLINLAQQIKDSCPQLSHYEQSREQRSMVSDIQQKFAEIYGIILRENENPENILGNNDAINSVVSIIQAVALAIKTKLNFAKECKYLDESTYNKLNDVCRDCFNISHKLNITPCSFEFETGLTSRMIVQDYKTGLIKSIMPGQHPGQIISIPFGNSEQAVSYIRMINQARQLLDINYQPNPEQIWATNPSAQIQTFRDKIFKDISKTWPTPPSDHGVNNENQSMPRR